MTDFAPFDCVALLAPFDPRQPAGHFEAEDETFQSIDHEMIKLGGLQELRLDWNYVDEASRQYLASQCKHFRIAGHLISARLKARSWRCWAEAAGVLAGMVEHYWETGHPKPGPTGYIAKRRLVALLADRLRDTLNDLPIADFSKTHHAEAQQALDRLQASAPAAQLDQAQLTRLESLLARVSEQARYPEPAAPARSAGQSGGQAISDEFFSSPSASLKPGDDRENRRSLLSVADFINQQDAYDPTGYQLRRFAMWAHLHAAPPARKGERTELMAVPADIADGYGEALTGNAVNPALLQRVEKSVVASPYWIRGSFLAAGIASRLEMKDAAAAIRLSTERFVRRIPALVDLKFSDGRAFIDPETLTWLSGADTPDGQGGALHEFGLLREELVAQLDSEGVEVVLRRLQDLQGSSASPRRQGHASVIAADLLASRGLSWLAENLYRNVAHTLRTLPAHEWEPELSEQLSKYTPAWTSAEPDRKG
ncbi:type VI secretion system protein TssA [Achromobacter seleniivolatilans]|uniref:Type VI secretion system protein TssA n=1 Tax=Achromobacter seleniivolatilans TaxID=3047478 RepID=A0ABY9M2Q3_9BURK|nr:type VI secretion system protein TssA [Achromobacter sp. R39]WMD21230.1 type VI secretion system protein TssA [Achromobacter sp. R39]